MESALLRECRRPTLRSWVGAALIVSLLLAETFAFTHALDSAAHTNGQPCTVCLSVTQLGHGAVSAPAQPVLDGATPACVANVAAVFVSIAPARRYARGPPQVSFAL